MMQNPLVGYPSFSHFLELRHQQYSSTRPPTTATPVTTSPPPPHFMYTSAFRPTLTPLNNDSSLSGGSPSPNNAKSFTIDAILGLRDGARLECNKYPNIATDLSINRANSNANIRQQHGSERHQNVGLLGIHPTVAYTSTCNRRTSEKSSDILSNTVSKKSAKSKRVRTIFTPEQLERLEAEFERQQYMVGPERLYLAHALQLTEAQVKVWFQNRRIKWRKQHLEMQQQRLAAIKQQQLQQQQLHGEEMDDSDTESNSGDDNSCYSNTTPAANSAAAATTAAVVAGVDER